MNSGILKLNNRLFLAPMAGFTDNAFRTVCKECGAGVLVSEMVSAKGLYYKDKKTEALMSFTDFQRPFGIQIFGSEPDIIGYAAKKCLETGADFIDFNMGCPTPKIVSNGDGSALMKNPCLAAKCVEAAVNAVNIPVTVKMRLGWDENSINSKEIALSCESVGAFLVTVHGRTKALMYSPPVNPEGIREVVKSVKIPVIANGDITDGKSAKNMLIKTGSAGLMIGRGAIGNPFVFSEIDTFLKTGEIKKASFGEKIDTAIRHLELLVSDKGERTGVLESRKHMAAYIKGIKGSNVYKLKVFEAKTQKEMTDILREVKGLCP